MSETYLDAAGLNALAGCFFEDTNQVHVGRSATTVNYATAVGANARATSIYAVAVGSNARAGLYATSLGYGANGLGSHVSVGHIANCGSCGVSVGRLTSCGNYGVSVGYNAGTNVVVNRIVTIGCNARAYANNAVAIGAESSCSTTDAIQLGTSSTSALSCAVELTTTSDSRDKTDVEPVGGACDFLANVQAVTYLRNPRIDYQLDEDELDEGSIEKREKYGLYGYDTEAWEAGEKKGERQRVGVIAQEVQAALEATYGTADYANLVNDSLHDYDDVPDDVESQLSVNYAGFVPFLIEAVNELRERVEALEGDDE